MRKSKLYLIGLLVLALSSCTSKKQQTAEITPNVPKIILETDIGNDVDDALALDMLYKYLDEYTDIMNTWYGYPQIPIGIIHNGADCENDATNYAKAVCLIQKDNGEPAFKRSLKGDYNQLPEAPALYRKLLAQQPDSSVTIISVGFSTNLARLLDTPADDVSPLTGKELVAQKVKLLCTMAGCFNNPNLFEYNVVKDIPAAKKIFSEWPTTLVTSPFEVGIAINYPGSSIENDFGWAPMHPVVEAYKSYQQMPYDRPTWDMMSVLYVLRPEMFGVSEPGIICVDDQGYTYFTLTPRGKHTVLTLTPGQQDAVLRFFVRELSSKPAKYR